MWAIVVWIYNPFDDNFVIDKDLATYLKEFIKKYHSFNVNFQDIHGTSKCSLRKHLIC